MTLDLARLKDRLRPRAVLAITLGSRATAVSVVRREESGNRVGKSFAVPIGAEAIIEDAEKAGAELAAQIESAGARERQCVVCIPPGWALSNSSEVPELAGEDLRGFLELRAERGRRGGDRQRAEREFPVAASELRLAHCAFVLPDGKRRVTLAAVPAKRIAAVERMLAAAGCKAVSISLGLDRCLTTGPTASAVHFLANGTHVDVVITAGGGIAALRSLATAAPPREAAFDAAGFCRDVRITLGRLPDALRQQVRAAHFGGTPESAETLCLKTRPHLERMGLDAGDCTLALPEAGAEPDAALMAAEYFLRDEPVTFEFIEAEVKPWQVWLQKFDSRSRRWMVGAALGLVVLPVLAFFVRSQIESSLAAEWDGMRGNVAELDVLQGKIRQFRPWFEPAPQTLAVFEALAGAFPDSGEVWAKGIQITDGAKVTCAGFTRNQPALLAVLDRLRARPEVSGLQVQQVRGENPIQFSVTYKWEAKHAK